MLEINNNNYGFTFKEIKAEPSYEALEIAESYCTSLKKSITEEMDEEVEIIPTINFENGDRYFGNVLNNRPHGAGTIITKLGLEISGLWDEGQLHGRITLMECYKGCKKKITTADFIKGKFQIDNDITILFPNGNLYCGRGKEHSFRQFHPHGKGELLYTLAGHKHAGNWKDGKLDGKGSLRFKNGNIAEAIWSNDRIVKHISFTFPNALKFFGPFNFYGPHGYGKIEFNNEILWAEWEDGYPFKILKIEDKRIQPSDNHKEITLLYHKRVFKIEGEGVYEETQCNGLVKRRKLNDEYDLNNDWEIDEEVVDTEFLDNLINDDLIINENY